MSARDSNNKNDDAAQIGNNPHRPSKGYMKGDIMITDRQITETATAILELTGNDDISVTDIEILLCNLIEESRPGDIYVACEWDGHHFYNQITLKAKNEKAAKREATQWMGYDSRCTLYRNGNPIASRHNGNYYFSGLAPDRWYTQSFFETEMLEDA